jgi:hypothetical protein
VSDMGMILGNSSDILQVSEKGNAENHRHRGSRHPVIRFGVPPASQTSKKGSHKLATGPLRRPLWITMWQEVLTGNSSVG